MLPRLPPPPIVPEASRRGTGGARLIPLVTLPPPPPIGSPVRSTPPDSPPVEEPPVETAGTTPILPSSLPPPPRSLLYSSMPAVADVTITTSDRSSGSGARLALGAQRLTRKAPMPSPLAQSTNLPPPPPLTKAQSVDVVQPQLPGRTSNPGKPSPGPLVRAAIAYEQRFHSPPGSPPQLSPRQPTASPPQSPPVSPRSQTMTDWITIRGPTRSPPGSPERTPGSPPRATLGERTAGYYSPPMSPDRSRSPPPFGKTPDSAPIRIKPQASFKGVFEDRSSTLSISAPDRVMHPPVFGVSLGKITHKEKEIPAFLNRLVTKIRSHEDISKEVYWIDSEFDPAIDTLQVSFSREYPDIALNLDGVSIRTLCGLLKRYFMFLVEPLLPHEIYDRLSPLRAMHHIMLRTQFMGSVLFSLNVAHRAVIMYMLVFLQDVLRAEYGIPIDRLSRAFGMVFFRAKMAFPSEEVKKAFQQGCAHVVEMLITHADELLHLDISYSNDSSALVLAAPVQSLLYKLIDPVYRDMEFTDTFFCCREYLGMNEHRLLERIIDLFNVVSEERLDEMRKALRLRTFEIIHKWIKLYEGILSDSPSSTLLQSWLSKLALQNEDETKSVEDITALMNPPIRSNLRFVTTSQAITRVQSVLQLEPEDIAIQLTIREFEFVKTLPISELMNKNFTREGKAPKWQASVLAFNRLASWVAQEIVIRKESLEARGKVITKLIAVCEALLRLNNYNSLFAVLGGLNNPGVNRLAQSWEKVPKKGIKAFKALMMLFDPGQNYRAYRESISTARPPFVPYLALLGKWLFAIEENNTTYLSEKSTIVNFDKMRNIYKVISQIRIAREGEYRFMEHPDFASLMNNEVIMTDDEIYERSLQCEARK